MTPELITFFVLGAVAVGAAVGMLLSRNTVYAALFLVLNFVTVAIFYVVLGAPFIAMTQVTVYAGAIMVLFLFVIMLLGAEELAKSRTFDWQKVFAAILAVVLLAEVAYLLLVHQPTFVVDSITQSAEGYGSPADLGLLLFTDYVLPFEVTSVLLLAAMVGVIAITRRRVRQQRQVLTNPVKEDK